jgi:hypothetical protein
MSETTEKALIHLKWLLECGCDFEYSASKTAMCYGVDRQALVDAYSENKH